MGRRRWAGTSGQQSLPNKVSTLEGHQDTVAALAVSQARSQLFSGSGDGTVKIWDWSAGFKSAHAESNAEQPPPVMCTASRHSIVSPARAQVRAHSASRCAGGGPPRRGRLAICGDRDLTVRPPSRRCVAASATTALHNHNHNARARAHRDHCMPLLDTPASSRQGRA